jgi:hypothetical protein
MNRTVRSLILAATLVALAIGNPSAQNMYSGDVLSRGQARYSANGLYRLIIRPHVYSVPPFWLLFWDYSWYDGSFADHYPDTFIWTTYIDAANSTPGYGYHHASGAGFAYHAVMQSDGNFVVFDQSYSSIAWDSRTGGNEDAWLNLQDDANLVVYSSTNVPLWSIF